MKDLVALDPTKLQRIVAAGGGTDQMKDCACMTSTSLQWRGGAGR
jgi:hypothetical protein